MQIPYREGGLWLEAASEMQMETTPESEGGIEYVLPGDARYSAQ